MALFDGYLSGGKKKMDQQPVTTANNPYAQYGGNYYDLGGFDYNRAVPSGSKGPVWKDGKFGFYRAGAYGAENFTPFSRQPQMVDAPPTPAGLQRDTLTTEYQEALDEAKAKTEERYQQALGNLEGVGEQQRADINTTFNSQGSRVNQSLVNSGLAGTTVAPSMQRGVERERQESLNRLAAMLAREKNQIIESRNDIPPDLQLYSQLMYQTGAGGVR